MQSLRTTRTASRPSRRKPRRSQEQRRTETRRKLIDSAIRLIRESGFAHLTIGAVASRASLTSGAVQHHFPSTQDLLRAIVEAVFPMLQIRVNDPSMLELSVSERVGRVIEVYWEALYGHADYLVIWELTFGTRGHAELHKLMHVMQKEFVAKAVSDLTSMFADIGMRSKAAFQLWTFIGSQLRGLALLSIFEEQRVLSDDLQLLKKTAAHLITIIHLRK